MKPLRDTLTVARREAAAYFQSPIAWVVLVLFLVVQGFSFWAVLQVLADPARPAPYGAVLRTHFGGTFLYWTFLFFVVAAISMRLVAEEKRQGTWESLLTAPLGEGPIIVGKWLGSLVFYIFLWAPTVAYSLILAAFAPAGAAPDSGPIVSAYAGVLVTGAAFLALGLLASASTANQIIAAVLAFVALLVLLLAGMTPELGPAFFARHGTLRAVAEALDVRRHMDTFARGVVDIRQVAVHAALTTAALVGATVVARAGRVSRTVALRGALGTALVATAALLALVTIHRHPASVDLTRARVYTLDAKTRQILADVRQPVRVLVLAGDEAEFRELYDEVDQLLRRFVAVQPLVTIEKIDPALDPGRIAQLATEYALLLDEVRGGGVVVFLSGGRQRAVGLLDMAEIDRGVMSRFTGEAEFATAVLEVTDDVRPEVCFSTGHGELELLPARAGLDLAGVVRVLARDLVRATPFVDLAGGVPARCAALAIFGATTPLAPAEATAVADYLDRGGSLLVAVEPDLAAGALELAATGLESVLLAHGVKLGPAVVVDPAREAGVPLVWATLDGYGQHPISAGFLGRRVTLWFAPRWIQALEAEGVEAMPLVACSSTGWAETDVVGLLRGAEPASASEKDVIGRIPVAVATRRARGDVEARVVVLGSARSFTTAVIDKQVAVNEALVASAVAWLTRRTKLIGVGAKTPEQFRLQLTADQVRRLFVLCVVLLPLLAAAAGALVWWRRRRGA